MDAYVGHGVVFDRDRWDPGGIRGWRTVTLDAELRASSDADTQVRAGTPRPVPRRRPALVAQGIEQGFLR